jgi:2-methylcitrate dehydratase PrpD
MDVAYLFARNFVSTGYEDIPEAAVEMAKREVLDILGVALGGSSRPGVRELLELVTEWGGKEESTILCYGNRVPAPNAAQVNATMSHALDYDDTGPGPVHASAVIVPTCLAMVERRGKFSGKEFITAVALGVDMMCRLGLGFRSVMASLPPEILETMPGGSQPGGGWHLTPLYGFFGAAGAAGRILGLDEEKMLNALGIAYHQSSGNGQCVLDGTLTKRMGPGFAAKGGITAALMAEKGITGAPNCLEGEDGLYKLYHRGKCDVEVMTADLGRHFQGVNAVMKPYPCCAGTHGYVSGTLSLVDKYDIKAEDVREITIYCRQGDVLCVPLEVRSRPRNAVDSQFSVPWAVAVAIARRRAGIGDFTEEAINSRDILDVSGKIRLEEIPASTKPGEMGSLKVEVKTREGQTYSERAGAPLDNSQGLLPFSDYERKFRDCASYSARQLPDENIERVIAMVEQLENVDDVSEIIGLLCQQG